MDNKMKKEITDDAGIVYEEVTYHEYLRASNKHRIIKTLESQYFVEKENRRRSSLDDDWQDMCEKIDKLAGDKLNGN